MGTYQRLYSDVEHEEKAKLSKRKGVDNHQCTGYAVPQIGGNLSLFTDPWVSQSLCLLGFDHGRMSNLVIREEADHLYVYRKVFRDLGRVFYNEGPRGILEFVELLFAKEDLYGLATAKESCLRCKTSVVCLDQSLERHPDRSTDRFSLCVARATRWISPPSFRNWIAGLQKPSIKDD